MADWITVTPPEPAGGYTIENSEITFSYGKNTTPNTRGATLEFKNPIAIEKNMYNPDSPSGIEEVTIYQFGRREMKLSASSSDSTTPGNTDCGAVTFFTNEWATPGYTDTSTANVDYTSCTAGCAGRDRNLEADWRCYSGFVSPTSFTVSVTISSTSPWLIGGSAFWALSPTQYSVPTETAFDSNRQTYPGTRTFDDDGNDTPVTVTFNIAGNSGSTARSANFYFINKQGYVHQFTINQKGYVAPNNHPTASITNLGSDQGCSSGTTTLRGGFSDPDGHGVSAYIWGGIASGGNRDTSVSFPSNSSCTSDAIGTATLRVRDSIGDESSTSSYQIATLPAGHNTCLQGATCSISCPSMVTDPNSTFECDVEVTATNNPSNCTLSTSVQSSPYGGVPANPGKLTYTPSVHFAGMSSGTVTINGSINNTGTPLTCTATSDPIQFAEPVGASLSFSGDGTQSGPSGNVTATCNFNDPNNATPHTFSMEGDCGGNTVTSSTSTLTIPFTGLQSGTSETCTASCTATNTFNQSASTGDVTTTISRPALTYNCNGYQNCVTITDGSGTYSTLADCQASSCYNTQPAVYRFNSGCTRNGMFGTSDSFSCSPVYCQSGQLDTPSAGIYPSSGSVTAATITSNTCTGSGYSCSVYLSGNGALMSYANGVGGGNQGNCTCTAQLTHSNGDVATVTVNALASNIALSGAAGTLCANATLFFPCPVTFTC